jgi:hypothetical protein
VIFTVDGIERGIGRGWERSGGLVWGEGSGRGRKSGTRIVDRFYRFFNRRVCVRGRCCWFCGEEMVLK